jgi:hypothetical protein
MNVIPPDTDELLWDVAREPESPAAEQFRARYPELNDELARRAAMLGGLKAARRGPGDDIPEPRVLSQRQPMISMPRWTIGVAAALFVFSIGLAFMAVVQNRTMPAETPALAGEANAGPPRISSHADQSNSTQELAIPQERLDQGNTGSVGRPGPVAPPPFEKLVSMSESSISLTNALNTLAAQAGIQITFAPGIEDRAVTVQFRDLPALTALKTLGQQNGLRVLEQSRTSVLVVPENGGTQPTLQEPTSGMQPSSQAPNRSMPTLPPVNTP